MACHCSVRREVELSVTAIARSLRVVLKDAAAPGMRVAILGPPSIEAVKVWQVGEADTYPCNIHNC